MNTRACNGKSNEVAYLEHVILRITLDYFKRGDLQIFLNSPSGTTSKILERRFVKDFIFNISLQCILSFEYTYSTHVHIS